MLPTRSTGKILVTVGGSHPEFVIRTIRILRMAEQHNQMEFFGSLLKSVYNSAFVIAPKTPTSAGVASAPIAPFAPTAPAAPSALVPASDAASAEPVAAVAAQHGIAQRKNDAPSTAGR